MAAKKSINPIQGIINVTGEPDSGKTWFAFNSGAQPERTAFFDNDLKGKDIVRQIKQAGRELGYYRNLLKEGKGMRELEFHNMCMKFLDELEPGKFDIIVWDTWTPFENTFHPYVVANPNKFRQFYSNMGAIKGAEQWSASFQYEATVMSQMTEIAPLIVLTSHLKKNDKKQDIAESKKPLVQKSQMRVYLRHNDDGSPVPVGLMLKRLAKVDIGNSFGMRPINVTHRKMKPFNWENLIYYWNNPVGDVAPGPDEQLNEFEMSILDGILTPDQKDVLRLSVIEAEREREEEERNTRTQQKLLKKNSIPNAMALLSKSMSDFDMDGDQVAEALGLDSMDEVLQLKGTTLEEAWKTINKVSKSNDE